MGERGLPSCLGDYVTLQRGNTYKSALLGQPGPLLLGLASIERNGGFKGDKLKTYGGESDPRMLLRPGDIYVSLKDVTQSAELLGAVARVPDHIKLGRLTQDTVKLEFVCRDVSRDYIYWLLRTPQYRAYCRAHATGTTNLGLPREDFLAFPIPEFTDARSLLVELLSALDDKIELNRKMNATLEAMARALFRDWFVDFGPTRARMQGRPPYLAPEIWSLFPDRLDDEGKPEGWEMGTLGDLIEFNPSEPLKKGTPAPYLNMAALPTQGAVADEWVERDFSSGMRFRNGDALLARITPCLENGKAAFIQSLPEGSVGWGSTEFIVMRARPPVPKPFSYLVVRHPEFRRHAVQSMSGTSGRQRTNKEAVEAFPFVVPSEEIWEAFGRLVDPAFEKIRANGEESRTLAQTRDLLLPRLMSGELRVAEAERLVEGEA